MRGVRGAFFRDVARAPSERAVAFALMDHGSELVGGFATGFYSMRDPTTPDEVHLRGLSEGDADFYEREGRAMDPFLRWVLEHHSVATADVEELRSTSPRLRTMVTARRPDLRQYMLAPIVVGGTVVGMMHFASTESRRFDVSIGSAIAIHVSTRVAVLRAFDSFATTWDGALTSREQEVAQLAARGLSTRDMARVAGISSNTVKKHLKQLYAKLGVASRGELSSLLLRGPHGLGEPEVTVALPRPQTLSTGVSAYLY